MAAAGSVAAAREAAAREAAAREAAAREAAARAALGGGGGGSGGGGGGSGGGDGGGAWGSGAWDYMWVLGPLRACKSLCERSSGMSFICVVTRAGCSLGTVVKRAAVLWRRPGADLGS